MPSPVDAYTYQMTNFPDWAIEFSTASAATQQWSHTLRVYDQSQGGHTLLGNRANCLQEGRGIVWLCLCPAGP